MEQETPPLEVFKQQLLIAGYGVAILMGLCVAAHITGGGLFWGWLAALLVFAVGVRVARRVVTGVFDDGAEMELEDYWTKAIFWLVLLMGAGLIAGIAGSLVGAA